MTREDVLSRKGLASARNIDAMKLDQMLQLWAAALGNNCQHRLVVFKPFENKVGVNHTLTHSQK